MTQSCCSTQFVVQVYKMRSYMFLYLCMTTGIICTLYNYCFILNITWYIVQCRTIYFKCVRNLNYLHISVVNMLQWPLYACQNKIIYTITITGTCGFFSLAQKMYLKKYICHNLRYDKVQH